MGAVAEKIATNDVAVPGPGTGPLRVLVVDDQRLMRAILRHMLGRFGSVEAWEAESAQEALRLLDDSDAPDPDIILCNLYLPGMDGFQFCNRVQAIGYEKGRLMPVLVLTSDKNVIAHDVARQLGAAAVLTKPVSATDLAWGIAESITRTDAQA